MDTLLDEMKFKGDRDYLQGADLLAKSLAVIREATNALQLEEIDITFHRMVRTKLRMVSDVGGADPAVRVSCLVDGERTRFWLVETGEHITDRCPYHEQLISDATVVDFEQRQATLKKRNEFNTIECLVAMTKVLHRACFPDAKGKWLFVRGKFKNDNVLRDANQLAQSVQLRGTSMTGITRSIVRDGDAIIGDIFFLLA